MRTFIPVALLILLFAASPTTASADDDGTFFSFKISTRDGGGPSHSGPHSYKNHYRNRDHHERFEHNRHSLNSRDYQRFLVAKYDDTRRYVQKRVVWTPPPRVYDSRSNRYRHQPCNMMKQSSRRFRW